MNKMVLYILFATIIMFFFSCNPTENNVPEFSAKLINTTDCKTFTILKNNKIEGDTPSNLDCFEYSFTNNVLLIKHINSGFNCCPGKLTADIIKTGNILEISEKEESPGCHCNCLFDFDYEIKGLGNTIYHIKFIEPYKLPYEQPLEADIDLSKNNQGKVCVERKHYPWKD